MSGPQARAMSASAATRTRTRGVRFTPRAGALALVVIALLFYLLVPLRTYMAQRDRLAQLQRQSQVLVQQNEQLRRQIAQLQDPSYLERIARECLGMVKPGEIGFIIAPQSGRAQPPGC
ncbi:MAG TPA: septum formation initiator family protein [Actinomycetota bacterium]|nr:septum formation initiator family protein [Actinomycetota bacterium]